MSSNLYRRDGIWYARVKVRGLDIRRSLRTGSKIEARKRLKSVMAQADQVRFSGRPRRTWKEAVIEWAAWAGAPDGLKTNTVTRYKVSLRQLRPHMDPLYIDEITRAKLGEIVAARKLTRITNATIRRDLTAVSSVLDVCEARDWIEGNAAHEYNRRAIKERRRPIALPDPADIDFVVSLAPGNFARMIRFAQQTGMRQDEIASLERFQWRQRDAAVDLTETKTSTPRVVPIDDRAGGTIRGTVPHLKSRYVFWHSDGLRYLGVSTRFRAIMRRAIDKAAGQNRPFRPFRFHDLRHWYAVDYLRQGGGGIYQLQKILGHKSIKTTELYLDYLSHDEQERAMHVVARNGSQV